MLYFSYIWIYITTLNIKIIKGENMFYYVPFVIFPSSFLLTDFDKYHEKELENTNVKYICVTLIDPLLTTICENLEEKQLNISITNLFNINKNSFKNNSYTKENAQRIIDDYIKEHEDWCKSKFVKFKIGVFA